MADPSAPWRCCSKLILGIRLAIDDSAGYSSLITYTVSPLDTLKIDRSFISGMGRGEGMEIARTILPMANNLR